jgi:mRNA interferase RelE/StbE
VPPPYRIEWLEDAAADVRAIDRDTAMRIFDGIQRFASTGSGDVTTLHGDLTGAFRLRLGDYRVLFSFRSGTMQIFGVRHRSEAYR